MVVNHDLKSNKLKFIGQGHRSKCKVISAENITFLVESFSEIRNSSSVSMVAKQTLIENFK